MNRISNGLWVGEITHSVSSVIQPPHQPPDEGFLFTLSATSLGLISTRRCLWSSFILYYSRSSSYPAKRPYPISILGRPYHPHLPTSIGPPKPIDSVSLTIPRWLFTNDWMTISISIKNGVKTQGPRRMKTSSACSGACGASSITFVNPLIYGIHRTNGYTISTNSASNSARSRLATNTIGSI